MTLTLLNPDTALTRLLASLEEARPTLAGSEEDFGFLSGLLNSRELQALIQVHNKISQNEKENKLHPVMSNAQDMLIDVLDELEDVAGINGLANELARILLLPHVQGIIYAHDVIAQKDYSPKLPNVPDEDEEEEEEPTLKIVQLVKSQDCYNKGSCDSFEPIVGATIKADENSGRILIARIMHGGAADRSGLIHVGDEVYEVNGIPVAGKTPNEVLDILKSSEGTITFKLIPTSGGIQQMESKVRVRAHFNFSPENDKHIPCKEAGLPFQRGDILHIVAQDDPYWWQARREGDKKMRAGLIPSRALQERRIIVERTPPELLEEVLGRCQSPKSPSCRPQPKVKKIMYDVMESDDFDREEIPTYEEVAKLYPRTGLCRPIVLIGPPGVGRNELKRRLIALDPDKYKTTVPYTSRDPRPGEVLGKDYIFVSRNDMERDIELGRFVEHGEYKGNLYGTLGDSILALVESGFSAVLTPHYQALKMLRTSQYKPFIIYIKPPDLHRLKETRSAMAARSTFDETSSRGFTDDELRMMLYSAERIEYHYGHLFDQVIVNDDLSQAFEQLVQALLAVETRSFWVPASWVQ